MADLLGIKALKKYMLRTMLIRHLKGVLFVIVKMCGPKPTEMFIFVYLF